MSNYLGSKSYLAMKPETTAGTAVKPTAFCPLVSESIKTILGLAPDRRMKGLDWKSDDLLAGDRKHEGDIVIYADGDNLGHLLNMTYLKGTTTGDETGYTHPFTVGSPDSYTIEIQKGPYAQRYFGVKADQLKVEFVDQKMQVTASVKAMGQFSVSALKEALSGAVTSLKLSSAYDMKPNSGLAVGDVSGNGRQWGWSRGYINFCQCRRRNSRIFFNNSNWSNWKQSLLESADSKLHRNC